MDITNIKIQIDTLSYSEEGIVELFYLYNKTEEFIKMNFIGKQRSDLLHYLNLVKDREIKDFKRANKLSEKERASLFTEAKLMLRDAIFKIDRGKT